MTSNSLSSGPHEWRDVERARGTVFSGHSQSFEIRCIVVVAGALLRFGLPAHRVEEAASRVGHAFGTATTVLGLPTALSVSVCGPRGVETHTVRAEPGTMDLERLDSLHAIVGRIERHELDAQGALDALERVVRAPESHGWWTRCLAGGLVAGGAAPAFGGNGADIISAFVLGACVSGFTSLEIVRAKHGGVAPILAALGVTLACAKLARDVTGLHPVVVTLAALVTTLPGFQLATATVELATGHWVSGTARATAAFVAFLELGFGVLLGLRFGAVAALTPVPIAPSSLPIELLGAVPMLAGFAILGNARRSDAAVHVSISLLAFGLCRGLREPMGAELATFIAAFTTGVVSHAFARARDRPSSVLLVPSAWMLVPGSFGLVGISAAILHEPRSAIDAVVRMAMLVLALGTGFILAASTIPPRTSI